jgi:hypothetical protein
MRRVAALVAWALLTTAVAAQQSAGLSEVKPLERFIGTWTYEGEDLTSGGGPVRCTSTRQWTGAGFFVESHRHCTTPRGEVQQLEVYGFDYTARVYRYWGFNGQFVSMYSTPAIDEAAIHWDSVAFPGRYRCSEAFEAGFLASASKCEMSTGTGAWVIVSQGRSKRVSP